MLLAAITVQTAALLVFTTVGGVPELLIARVVQGLATGAGDAGIDLADVMRQTRHQSLNTLRKYIRDRSGMNTSESVANALGDHVRTVCDE